MNPRFGLTLTCTGGSTPNSAAAFLITSGIAVSELITARVTLPTFFNARPICSARNCPPKARSCGQQDDTYRILVASVFKCLAAQQCLTCDAASNQWVLGSPKQFSLATNWSFQSFLASKVTLTC